MPNIFRMKWVGETGTLPNQDAGQLQMRPASDPLMSKPGEHLSIGSRVRTIGRFILAWVFTAGVSVAATSPPTVFHPVWNQPGETEVDGVGLMAAFNCRGCHRSEEQEGPLMFSRSGPILTTVASRVTPQFLRAFLSDPQAEKPGTAMPDLLHGLDPQAKREAVEELVHYLGSLGKSTEETAVASNPFKMAEGKSLYDKVGCVACHGPEGSEANSSLSNQSIPLGPLAKKYTVQSLAAYLMNPAETRPLGGMPSLNLTFQETVSMAMFLLREQTNNASAQPSQKVQGLYFEYFENRIGQVVRMDRFVPKNTGTVENFSLTPKQRENNIGFRYTGLLRIPRNGTYTFYTSSDDGSVLYVGNEKVVDNDGEHGTVERSGSIALEAGDHPIMLLWSNLGGGAELQVSYEGPGLSKQPIPNAALSYLGQSMKPLEAESFTLDAAKAARGRDRYAALGCAACHDTGSNGPLSSERRVPSLLELKDGRGGCLGDSIPSHVPKFALSDAQRESLRRALQHPEQLGKAASPAARIAQLFTALNCYACHRRDTEGGPTSDRAKYFVMETEDDMGDEGRLPPHLSGVGSKLRPEWLREVLHGQGRVRPYMATRMPRFGEAYTALLPEWMAQADAADRIPADAPVADSDVKYGRALVGTGGMSCISCHVYAGYRSLGIQAMDLTQMAKRLRQDWFRRYLRDPQSLRPGTRMPSFWPEGKSLRDDILNGDTERQIDAIWAYLTRASDAGVPPGLIQGRLEIAATNEAVIYRAFLNESGTRGIGVAYPEKANLTFDASEMRWALIWQGPFIDAAQHRSGRGAGFVGPLGYNVLKLPSGPPLAALPTWESDWPTATGREAGYTMRGYQLDDHRRPVFRYEFQGVQVEDYPIAEAGELEASFKRGLTFRADKPRTNLWFRAWEGTSIAERARGTYFAEGKVELQFDLPPGVRPSLRQRQGHMELLIPVVLTNGEFHLVERIIW